MQQQKKNFFHSFNFHQAREFSTLQVSSARETLKSGKWWVLPEFLKTRNCTLMATSKRERIVVELKYLVDAFKWKLEQVLKLRERECSDAMTAETERETIFLPPNILILAIEDANWDTTLSFVGGRRMCRGNWAHCRSFVVEFVLKLESENFDNTRESLMDARDWLNCKLLATEDMKFIGWRCNSLFSIQIISSYYIGKAIKD